MRRGGGKGDPVVVVVVVDEDDDGSQRPTRMVCSSREKALRWTFGGSDRKKEASACAT